MKKVKALSFQLDDEEEEEGEEDDGHKDEENDDDDRDDEDDDDDKSKGKMNGEQSACGKIVSFFSLFIIVFQDRIVFYQYLVFNSCVCVSLPSCLRADFLYFDYFPIKGLSHEIDLAFDDMFG